MKLSRDAWLAIGVVLILLLVTVGVAIQKTPVIPYTSTSSAANGTLALKLWLQSLGYVTSDKTSSTYQPPQNADLILILQPVTQVTDAEWSLLDQRISGGATLILAGDNPASQNAFAHFGFSTTPVNQSSLSLTVQSPLLTSPILTSQIPVTLNLAFVPSHADFVTLLAVGAHPVVASFEKGAGRVILASTAVPFSNLALKDQATSGLVLNLIALSVRRQRAWFDEWHHGLRPTNTVIGPDQWLRQTPLGHAFLFIVAALFLALFMQGRGFGRPVPLPHEIKRRGPLEHVTAIANLSRRAGHRSAVMQKYYSRLKRHLARRYSLDPSLPDDDYVRELAQHNSLLDQKALLDLLRGLTRRDLGEDEMIQLARQASNWMEGAN